MDEKRLRTLDEQIAEALRQAQESGELEATKSYGKPMDFGDGYDDTPAELRMAFKILKDSGFAPAEVQLFTGAEAQALRTRIHDLDLKISLRLERLSKHGV